MEKTIKIEVSVKSEPRDPEELGESPENANNQQCKEEVWLKQEPVDDAQTSIKVEEQSCDTANDQNESGKGKDIKLELPLKKRIDTKAKDGSDQTCVETSNTGKTPDGNQYSEIPSMYSYDITKHIQIVTIDEEERQIEHREILSTRQHMRHVCENCAVGFVVEEAFMMHMKVHTPESGGHECDVCHTWLKSADMLYRHRLRHYRRYRCLLCAERFKDKDRAACHVMTEHQRQAFLCTECGKSFKRPQYLKRHVEQHHTKPHRLECPVCHKVFHERGWYRSHVRTHNEEVKTQTVRITVTCDVCSRNFHTKASLKRHLATHEDTCRVCAARCATRHELAQHYLNVHNEVYKGAPDETCPQCLRVCATREMLRHHMRRMHADRTKKYECWHCSRLYLTKGEVRAHISWSHLAAAGHACGCGRRFRTPALLRDHRRRLHAPAPPPRDHACDHCGKAFGNKQVLNRHKKSHSNEMYPCNECGLLFKTQPYVKIHYQIKHLNMTRAQIKEQRKKNRNRTAQGNIQGRQNTREPQISKVKDTADKEAVDPLEIREGEVEIQLKEDSNIQVPLFQTFKIKEV